MRLLFVITLSFIAASTIVFAQNSLDDLDIIFQHNFEENTLGSYVISEWREDWLDPEWGSRKEELEIVQDKDDYVNPTKALKIDFPANSLGPGEGGTQWRSYFSEQYEEMYYSTDVYFMPGFDFQKGGKLPALKGGSFGIERPTGYDGFFSGLMFKGDYLVFYTYYADQPSEEYGESFEWGIPIDEDEYSPSKIQFDYAAGEKCKLTPGQWHNITYRLVLNSINDDGSANYDGILEAFFNGKLVTQISHILFRRTSKLKIDYLETVTFFGGATDPWRNPIYEWLLLDNVMLYNFKPHMDVPTGNILSETDRTINYWRAINKLNETSPEAPGSLSSSNVTTSSVTINWKDNSINEAGFKIYRAINNSEEFKYLATVHTNVTSYTDDNLSPGTSYTYRIRAYNDEGYSAYSPTLTVSTKNPPKRPTNLIVAESGEDYLTLQWNDNSNNELRFNLQRKDNSSGSYQSITSPSTNETTYTDTGLNENTVYFYRIRAYNNDGYSSFSNVLQIDSLANVSIPNAPGNLVNTSISVDHVSLSWTDNSAIEQAFDIERSVDENGSFLVVATLNSNETEFIDDEVNEGTKYFYRVKCYNKAGNSSYSNELEVNTPRNTDVPIAPSNLLITSLDTNNITLSWKDNSHTEQAFDIERSINENNDFLSIATINPDDTVFTDNNVIAGTKYYYRVRCYNKNGYSNYSNSVEITTPTTPTLPLAPSDLSGSDITFTTITLSWHDNSLNEVGFQIERSSVSDNTESSVQFYIEPNHTSYTDTNLIPNSRYIYRIRAYNNIGYSEYSNTLEVSTPYLAPPEAPSELKAVSLSHDQITISWHDNSKNENSFLIRRSLASDPRSVSLFEAKANDTVYTDISVFPNTNYVYSIYSSNAAGSTSSIDLLNTATLSFAESKRVKEGLIAYYNFNLINQNIIPDLSGFNPTLDLEILDPEYIELDYNCKPNISDHTAFRSRRRADKVVKAFKTSKEITVECWVRPNTDDGVNTSSIVCLGSNDSDIGFQLGQSYSNLKDTRSIQYQFRLQTGSTSSSGYPELLPEREIDFIELHHIVYTRDSLGQETFYLNGEVQAEGFKPSNFKSWNESYYLYLANNASMNSPWLGSFYTFALYTNALSEKQIHTNYISGPCDNNAPNIIDYNLKVWPNPLTNNAVIEILPNEVYIGAMQKTIIRVIDAFGQIHHQEVLFKPNEPYLKSMAFDEYPKGIYYLQIISGNYEKSTRFIIK